MLSALDRDGVGQPEQACLGSRVMGLQRLAEHSRRGGNEYKASVTLRLHHPKCVLAQIESTIEMHTQHAAPITGRKLLERHAVEDARIAHHSVEAAEMIDCCSNDCFGALGTIH